MGLPGQFSVTFNTVGQERCVAPANICISLSEGCNNLHANDVRQEKVLNATVKPASPEPSKALSLGKGSSEFKVPRKITPQPNLGNSLNGLMVPINPQRYKLTKAQRVASVNACRELSEHSGDLQL
mgnify:CR=1